MQIKDNRQLTNREAKRVKELHFSEGMAPMAQALTKGGVFLSSGGLKPNTMTIGWGSVGAVWAKPMLIAMVRPSRFTYRRIQETGCFTVSIPTKNGLKEQLVLAGTASGRDMDKFTGHGLTAADAQVVSAPIVAECGLHYECVVRYDQSMDQERLYHEYRDRYYPQGDYHTMFYGEIVAYYSTDE